MTNAVLIVNLKARTGRRFFRTAKSLLEKSGITLATAIAVKKPKILPNIVQQEIANGAKFIILGGGDGTVRSVLDQFAFKDVTLGILPLGTGNGFARSLGIPLTLSGAVNTIANGKTINIDLGKANNLYFANTAAVGFSLKLARKTPSWLKKTYGLLAFGFVGLKYLFTGKSFHYRVTAPNQKHDGKTHQLIIANGSFIGGTLLTPEARIGNHQLLVVSYDAYGRWEIIKQCLAFTLGKPSLVPSTRFFTTPEVHLETTPVRYLDLDGEIVSQTPVSFSVAPNALSVRVPLSFKDPD